jgi:c-di-GMP-related signal transduction protein
MWDRTWPQLPEYQRGRNRNVMVSSMQKFIARQPILDRSEELFGYELLFRAADESFCRTNNPEMASASVISDSLFLYGINELTDGTRAFVNCTRETLLRGFATLIPRDHVVVEILETVTPDEEVIAACRALKAAGYTIALDDFDGSGQTRLVEFADIIKVDVLACTDSKQREMVRKHSRAGIKFLAEKVETRDQFNSAVQKGYVYFQGYFFCRPQTLTSRDIGPVKLAYFRLLQAVMREEIDVNETEEAIKRDLSLSYKLLRFLNSPLFAFRARVHSIRNAVVLLGHEELRKWVALVSVSALGEGKSPVLIQNALIRAAFCESFAPLLAARRQSDFFFLGLLSNIDAILGRPLRAILRELPLHEDVSSALLGGPNTLRDVLDTIIAYEQADWSTLSVLAKKLSVREEIIPEMFFRSTRWCRELCAGEAEYAEMHPAPAVESRHI